MADRALLKLGILLAIMVALVFPASVPRDQEEEILAYTVPRPEPTSRLIGAIIPRGEQAWFFKLAGPNQAVKDQSSAFRELVQSVTFASDAGQPTWTLPKGWVQRPGSELRFATLEVQSGTETLDCSVTALPITDPDFDRYLLANINRWRDQLRVTKISESDLAANTSQLKLASGDLTATIVEFAGEMSASPMARPMAASTTSERPPTTGSPKEEAPKLTYEVPPGWTPGALDVSRAGITVRRAAAFEVRDGDQRVEITVTKLPASAVLANVNRWRGQIGMDSITNQQFDQAKKQIEFAGASADYVQFVGEKEAILGVISVVGREAWFVKLQGAADLAAREKQHFEAFVRSIRL